MDPQFPNIFSYNHTGLTEAGYNLLAGTFEYDPIKRLSADAALKHPYFSEEPLPSLHAFHPNLKMQYPIRKLQPADDFK
ncbi:UNVERIFIED_CONTAM: hypothetical protein HDU68_010264 [Siphonaria sp. JEL0065]|nr:hypothetical protein HDU68_010264 [Siphonaria sp. JEL0065]